MPDLGYVGGLLGASLGLLGAITGVFSAMVGMNPEKHFAKLRAIVWVDTALGFVLMAGGTLVWLVSSTNYGYDLGEILFFSGTLMVSVVAVATGNMVPTVRKFIHISLVSGLIFLALGTYSHFTQAEPGRKNREFIWAVGFLSFSTLAWLYHRITSKRRTESAP